jgi:hypothetical protein
MALVVHCLQEGLGLSRPDPRTVDDDRHGPQIPFGAFGWPELMEGEAAVVPITRDR